jgi:hypothetical protein
MNGRWRVLIGLPLCILFPPTFIIMAILWMAEGVGNATACRAAPKRKK